MRFLTRWRRCTPGTLAADERHALRTASDAPTHRYNARLANEIEAKWQDRWEPEHTFWTPTRPARCATGRARAGRPKLYVLDMFPYPSGEGLHVGHPARLHRHRRLRGFMRMNGRNVLHAMGYDAFGLPAEQYAVETGQHPRVTTDANVATMRRQLRALGLGHDPRRGIATTDVAYYRWTQWIFLQIFNSWFDDDAGRARPIAELVAEFEAGTRAPMSDANPDEPRGPRSTTTTRREVVDSYRLAYLEEAIVNWCPALGTVLANEEVTADGRSDRGNHPVFKRPLKQWMLQITSYADRLLADLDLLDWPESIKTMQRNWIGRSVGANVVFPVEEHEGLEIEVFTTRPDTLFGATYMVLAPEHPLSTRSCPTEWPDAVLAVHVGDMPARGRASSVSTCCPPKRCVATASSRSRSRSSNGRPKAARRPACSPARSQEPHERLEHPDLHRRLRADGLRHGGDHGGARARRARLRVRTRVRAADRRRRAAARRLVARSRDRCRHARRRVARGLRRRRRGDELDE